MLINKKTKVLLIILIIIVICRSEKQDKMERRKKAFKDWKEVYGKKYKSSDEDAYRQKVFISNLERIQAMNQDPTRTDVQVVNQITDLTDKEFFQNYLNPMMDMDVRLGGPAPQSRLLQSLIVNTTIDHTASGLITPVRNQGQCGSCWAFAAVGTLQFLSKKRDNVTRDLSQQQYVDCVYTYNGCDGGWPSTALKQTLAYGIESQAAYPYKAKYSGSCLIMGGSFKISSISSPSGCQALINSLSTSAIAVAVDASGWGSYGGGVKQICGTSINHAVLLVGVSPSFWKIKNSWGTWWGQSGYIRLALGNTCGICKYAGSFAK